MRYGFDHRLVLFCLAFFLSASVLVGQRALSTEEFKFSDKTASPEKMPCTSDAGSLAGFSNFQLSSNSFGENVGSGETRAFAARPDTIFLCFGDQFQVDYTGGSEDLSGDPDASTLAGIGYAFYNCQPTVSGSSREEVANDPCVTDNGQDPFDELAVGIPNGYEAGNYDFIIANDGDNITIPTIPSLFPGPNGEPTPVVLTLAPITVDSVNPERRAIYEVMDDGSGNAVGCVDVSTDQAFSVAFLNEITVANLNGNPASCEGSFDVRGGVSELRNTADYSITVTNQATGEVATLENPAGSYRHDDVVRYTVPRAGTYVIAIEDEVSCALESVTVTHPEGCADQLGFAIECAVGGPGEAVCVPLRTTNFTDVSAFNFGIQYDPAVISFDAANSPVVRFAALSGGTLNATEATTGEIRLVYENAGNPATLGDGEDFIELCFNVVGTLGDVSPLAFVGGSSGTIESGGSVEEQNPIQDLVDCTFSVLSDDLMFTAEIDSVSCPGEADGRITVTVTGGTAPYTVNFTRTIPPPATTGPTQAIAAELGQTTFNGLVAGFYDVTVADDAGAMLTREVQVLEGISFGVSINVFQRPQCNGDDNGILIAEVSENTNPVVDPTNSGYRIQWNTGATTDTISGLPDGTYSVTITDVTSGCTREASIDLDEPNALFIDVSQSQVDDATCSGAGDGAIRVRAVGGVQDANGDYTFNWSDGFSEQSPESNRTDLDPGDYQVTVVDVNGCNNARSFTVGADKELIPVIVKEDIDCFGDDNGRISVSGSFNGSAPVLPYDVSLVNIDPDNGSVVPFQPIVDNSTPLVFDNLVPGTYVVVLRDQDPQGCQATDTVTIVEPPLLEIGELTTVNAGCPDVLGSVEVPVTGGTQPYQFRFVNDSLDMPLDSITELNAPRIGDLQPDTNYVLIVTDANGCIDSARFEILAPAGPALQPIATDFVSCPGDANGQLTVVAQAPAGETITGYTWYRINPDGTLGNPVANAATTQANLSVGFYAVEVFSSNQCSSLDFGAVESPGVVQLDTFVLNNPSCAGDANGSIFVSATGGTPNANDTYNYVWSTDPNGAPTQNPVLTNLTAGTYSVTITDANDCRPFFDTTFVLMDPPSITGSFLIEDVSCPDDLTDDGTATFTAEFSDGTQGTFDFTWSTGETDLAQMTSTITNLSRGPINVRVSDGICTETFRDTIRSPEEFTVNVQPTDVSCNGSSDGAATVVVTGGTPDYTFSWVGLSDTDNSVDNLAAGVYQFEVIDSNGCSPGTQVFDIAQPDPLTLALDPTVTTNDVTCAGDTDGVIGVFVSSANNNPVGANPYTWSANVSDNDDAVATGLAPGTYSVTITDIEGCQDSISHTIGEPEAIVFTVVPIAPPLCFGETTPILIDTAFGGQSRSVSDFTFSVNNDGFRIPVGQSGTAFAGDITVSVFDSVGCAAEQTFSVSQPPQILIDLPEEITIELGDSLTRLEPLISPAGDVYSYRWTPADFLSSDSIRNPLIFPFDSRDYTLTVTNQNNCQAFADIFVEVDANRNVYIPNAFSPNRDGRNEDFRIFACQGVSAVNTVRIFDRWGGLVFEEDNLAPNCLDGIQLWDGIGRNGRPVNPGVFVYMVEVTFLDNVKLLYRGDIAVVR